MKLINLALRSEYSFKQTFQHITQIEDGQEIAIGVADINNTFSHVPLEKQCKTNGIKPIFGVRLMVVENPHDKPKGQQGNYGPIYIFIAKNIDGLREIYSLVKKAYELFFYRPHIGWIDLFRLSSNVIVITNSFKTEERIDYIGVNYTTPKWCLESNLPKVFINDNEYPSKDMRPVYELLCGSRKTATGYSPKFDSHTYPTHILSTKEFLYLYNNFSAIENSHIIAEQCNVVLPKAEMVKYPGPRVLERWCAIGANKRNINLNEEAYKIRYEREMQLIKEKNYGDYFLNVAEMIDYAKQHMLVGPARGSSAGSLVCYLIGITEVDPITHGLLFERFIDLNRADLPDIDADFPDKKRNKVIKFLIKEHGENNVSRIATISRYKAKTAIGEFACALDIPPYETTAVKDAIIERHSGDARASACIRDTLETTEIGKELVVKYPAMKLTAFIEDHASHAGTHAAGVIVCNKNLSNYGGINSRDGNIMLGKSMCEYLGLLKIDVLGLRTLTILEDCAHLAKINPNIFYTLPLDDESAFKVFNQMRLQGIFQFEGLSLQFITRQIGVHEFSDIVAITALARPGAMNSGGTARYIECKLGKKEPVYRSEIHKAITEESMGIVIYQEQMMSMAKEIGDMTWGDVSSLRKAASSSLGDEFFGHYKKKFIKGAMRKNNYSVENAEKLWQDISATGSWTFNKSHAVSYGLVSYWTAWCKAHYPLEFAAANLNNARSDDSAIRILRDMVKNENVKYIALDPDHSEINWSIKDGKLLGGLTSIDGIGLKKAQGIIKARTTGTGYTKSIVNKLMNPITPFVDIFPCKTRYGALYKNPIQYGMSTPLSYIENVIDKGEYTFIGKLKLIDLRDRNDYQSVVKRGGTKVTNNQFYLKMFVEDDTDTIMVMISPQSFDSLNGRAIAEKSKIDHTWFLIRGKIQSDWRMITISTIFDLTEWSPDK